MLSLIHISFGPRRRHGPPGGVPPARNRHGQFGIRADRPLRTLRIRPLRHRRRLFPQAQPYADLRKRRGVPPHGAPAHGVHVTMSVSWNPWHGCRKISEGCRNCYVYQMCIRDSGGTVRSDRRLTITIDSVELIPDVALSWLDSAKQFPLNDEYLPPLLQSDGGYDLAANGTPQIIIK